MRPRLRRPSGFLLLAAALAALAITGTAGAKSYSLPQAAVSVQVAKDGSQLVDEHITYAFSGPFSGGFRDIPLRDGETIDRVRVTENGRTPAKAATISSYSFTCPNPYTFPEKSSEFAAQAAGSGV